MTFTESSELLDSSLPSPQIIEIASLDHFHEGMAYKRVIEAKGVFEDERLPNHAYYNSVLQEFSSLIVGAGRVLDAAIQGREVDARPESIIRGAVRGLIGAYGGRKLKTEADQIAVVISNIRPRMEAAKTPFLTPLEDLEALLTAQVGMAFEYENKPSIARRLIASRPS